MTALPEPAAEARSPSRPGAFVRRNPVMLKELRGRMRGARAFIVLTVYVALMSLFAVLLYAIYTASAAASLSTTGGVVGKLIFGGVVAVELLLVCFVAPAFTAAAISGERERRTFNLLRTTLLPARRIVLGKLASALAYIVLLLLVAVPLQSLAFLMGGVTAAEVILSLVLLFVTAVAYGAMGIFFSAVTRRTLTASIVTYSVALFATVVLPLASLFAGIASPFGAPVYRSPLIEAFAVYGFGLLVSTNPLATAVVTEIVLQSPGSAFFFTHTLSNGRAIPLVSPWVVYTLFCVLVTIGLVAATVRSVRRMEASD